MNRLLQGDVGSGKTVVAGLAMYAAISAGKQAALMVPTEILAEQHKESLENLFPDLPVALLTGGLKAAEKREVLEEIASGTAQLIVGTHALIQEGVHYQDLGLVVLMSSTVLSYSAPDPSRKGQKSRCLNDDCYPYSSDFGHYSLRRYGCVDH